MNLTTNNNNIIIGNSFLGLNTTNTAIGGNYFNFQWYDINGASGVNKCPSCQTKTHHDSFEFITPKENIVPVKELNSIIYGYAGQFIKPKCPLVTICYDCHQSYCPDSGSAAGTASTAASLHLGCTQSELLKNRPNFKCFICNFRCNIYANFKQHLYYCQLPAVCARCKTVVPRGHLDVHANECPDLLVKCYHCNMECRQKFIDEHRSYLCLEKLVSTLLCGHTVARKDSGFCWECSIRHGSVSRGSGSGSGPADFMEEIRKFNEAELVEKMKQIFQ